jgi:hypothetical protein
MVVRSFLFHHARADLRQSTTQLHDFDLLRDPSVLILIAANDIFNFQILAGFGSNCRDIQNK